MASKFMGDTEQHVYCECAGISNWNEHFLLFFVLHCAPNGIFQTERMTQTDYQQIMVPLLQFYIYILRSLFSFFIGFQ